MLTVQAVVNSAQMLAERWRCEWTCDIVLELTEEAQIRCCTPYLISPLHILVTGLLLQFLWYAHTVHFRDHMTLLSCDVS